MKSCPKCGTEVAEEESFCPNCGISIQPDSSLPSSSQDLHTRKEYREPTMTLRMAIFFLYFGVFMTLAAIGAATYVFWPSLFVTLPFLLFELWIARNLGSFNKWPRIALILLSIVIVFISFTIFVVNPAPPGLPRVVITLIALYEIYALVLHQDTTELFSGKYQPEPDYNYFGTNN